MTKRGLALYAVLLMALLLPAVPAHAAKQTKCDMRYTLREWSIFYKVAHGDGVITCDNGQRAEVHLRARGGGLTAGKAEVRDGHGEFSPVSDIHELFGNYAAASAEAGAVKSAGAAVVTKGEVTLGLTGKGTGWQLGISFSKFSISPE
jgi:hypothetical protein